MIQEIGLIGKKIGMTREFYKSGQSVPVTAVKIDKGRIIQIISKAVSYTHLTLPTKRIV